MPPFPLNAPTVDQMLDGGVTPEDAPPGYGEVVAFLNEARREAALLPPPNCEEVVAKMAAAFRRKQATCIPERPSEPEE